MNKLKQLRLLSGTSFLTASLALMPLHTASAEEQDVLEEVVVTGSYIRRKDTFDLASPLDVLDATDISGQGVAAMGEILKNQTFNYGTDVIAVATASTFQDGSRSFANLRGLGQGATLTLVNGRRSATGNINLLYPQIAIARIETLKDGASALYGSDAVAGVVNILPITNFNGFKVDVYALQPDDSRGDYDETRWSVLFGSQSGPTRFTTALEWRERGRLKWQDRPAFNNAQFSSSGTGNPGTWLVPSRLADGSLSGTSDRIPDPGCGIDPGPGGTDKNNTRNNISGVLVGTTCRLEFGEFWDYMTKLEAFTGYTFLEYDLADNITLQMEVSFARHQAFGRGSPSNPGGQIGNLGIIPGDHPGNPWRAFYDGNGNGVIDAGEHLFAMDANADGLPDRDAAGLVVLAADPFDPALGIAFNEDVFPAALRLVGKLGTLPSRHNSDGSGEGATSSIDRNYRWVGGAKFEVPDSSWTGELFYTYQQNNPTFPENQAESFSAVRDGINGRLGFNQDEFYNPFSTTGHPCVDRICNPNIDTGPGDPGFNSQAVMDRISFRDDVDWRNTLNVVDLVITGDAFELPAGMLAVAVGGQWRRTVLIGDEGPVANACDRWVNQCGFDFKGSRTTHAIFGELAAPIFDNDTLGVLDLSIAVRFEDSGDGLDSTDPKYALRWQPRDWLALRASFGTSFIAPSLTAMFQQPVSFLENMTDPTCAISGECSDPGSFRTQTFGGNPDLIPEEADVWNVGVSFSLFEEDLVISVDYTEFDFTDRISRLRGQDILDADAVRFASFGGSRADWIDPVNKATGNFESQGIKRSVSGEIVEVLTAWVNAQTMLWQGIDISVKYRWDADEMPWIGGNYGEFSLRLDGTYVDTYEYTLTGSPTELCGGTGLRPPCEGAGARNDRTSVVPPIPRLRTNARLNWNYASHATSLTARYIHHVTEDSVFRGANPKLINSRVTYDAHYGYTREGLFGADRDSAITIGCINCFDTLTDPMLTLGGLETFLHDPRGRMFYARISQSL